MTMAGWAMEPTDIKIENTKRTTAWERKWFVTKQSQNSTVLRCRLKYDLKLSLF
jgi:hypothetical protein